MERLTITLNLSLFIWGIAALFDEGMILEKFGDWLLKHIGPWLSKPLFSCPVCMSSFWSIVASAYLLLNGYEWSVDNWIFLAISTCGLNYIIMKHLSR